MSLKKPRRIDLSIILAASALAAVPASSAFAQDLPEPAPATGTTAAPPSPASTDPGAGNSRPSDAAATDATATGTSVTQPDPAAALSSGPDKQANTKPKGKHAKSAAPVCFDLSKQCVGGKSPSGGQGTPPESSATGSTAGATAVPAGSAAAGSQVTSTGGAGADGKTPAKKPLNLAAPDISTVVSADELKEPLPDSQQEAEAQEAETVQVKAANAAPDVPGGFAGVWWAMKHPIQAWRLFTPAQ